MADYVQDYIGIDLTAIYASASAGSTTQLPAAPGQTVRTTNGGVYVFARANSTIAQFDAVVFSHLGQSATTTTPILGAVPVTTTNCAPGATAGTGMVGLAQVAITSAYYGWIALQGTRVRVKTLIGCNPNVPLYTTGTAGSLDDTTVSAGYIPGLTLLTSATSASAPLAIASYPKIIVLGAG
jgi:hypothetical protein